MHVTKKKYDRGQLLNKNDIPHELYIDCYLKHSCEYTTYLYTLANLLEILHGI